MPEKKTNSVVIAALQELLRHKTVGSQEEISAALKKKGFSVNQVKISRLLHKIGAIKITEDEKIVYRLPTELVTVSPKDTLRQLILEISHNETLIVIQTVPGAANLVARMLDLKKDQGILGTVAGDDTIFVAPIETKQIKSIQKNISRLLLD